jgi:hypothetical protein
MGSEINEEARQRTDRFVLWADISAVSGNGTGHEEGEKSDNKGAAHSQKYNSFCEN